MKSMEKVRSQVMGSHFIRISMKLKAENLELRKELELLKKFQAFLKKKST